MVNLFFLEQTLEKEYKKYYPELINQIENIDFKKHMFKLIELSPEILIIANKDKKTNSYNLGFPFPLKSKNVHKDENKYPGIDIYLRGEPIRSWQRNQLFKKVDSLKIIETSDIMQYQTKQLFLEAKDVLYIDPYTHIGDSIIGMHILESFSKYFNITNKTFSSASFKHTSKIHSSIPKHDSNLKKALKKTKHIIIPDFIDTHWKDTIKYINLIRELKKDKYIAIVGRNILLSSKKGILTAYWYKNPDPLLRNKNIEDYMDDTIETFIPKQKITFDTLKTKSDIEKIMINPFGSLDNKEIPTELVNQIYISMKKKIKKQFNITIIGGYREKPSHQKWIEEFLKKIEKTENIKGKISITYYSDLSAISEDITNNNFKYIISADTSITHFANRLGVTNFTIYNPHRWDSDSIQSLTSESPLGFCRYFSNQIPVINTNNNISKYAKLANSIVDGIIFYNESKYFQKKQLKKILKKDLDIKNITTKQYKNIEIKIKNSKLSWMTEIYSPNKITPHLDKLPKYLKQSAIKISPIIKIIRQEKDTYEYKIN